MYENGHQLIHRKTRAEKTGCSIQLALIIKLVQLPFYFILYIIFNNAYDINFM
jgi:hypothetical protein